MKLTRPGKANKIGPQGHNTSTCAILCLMSGFACSSASLKTCNAFFNCTIPMKSRWWKVEILIMFMPWPRVHKAFQNQDQDQAQVKNYYGLSFNLLLWFNFNIDCWYSIKHVLQTRLLGILSFFYKRNGKFYSYEHYDNLSPINNRMNFIIVNWLQHVL